MVHPLGAGEDESVNQLASLGERAKAGELVGRGGKDSEDRPAGLPGPGPPRPLRPALLPHPLVSRGRQQSSAEDVDPRAVPGMSESGKPAPPSLTLLSHPAGTTTCQQQTCECDKRAALCFRDNLGTYNSKYAHYPNQLCTGPTPPC